MRLKRPSRRRILAFVALFVSVLSGASLWGALRPEATANPFAAHRVPLAERVTFRGHVEQRLPAGPYVYLLVRPEVGDDAPVWVTSLASTTPREASSVDVRVLGRAESFPSKRLSRTFSPLIFAIVRAARGAERAELTTQETL